jgi:hypothetical protein
VFPDLPEPAHGPPPPPYAADMTAPPPSPHREQFAAAVESLKLQVDRDTVLQARASLLGEAFRLHDAIKFHAAGITVGMCGGDPVSADAAPAFSERIGPLLDHCVQYAIDLQTAGEVLGAVARRYGLTEDEIAASFAL